MTSDCYQTSPRTPGEAQGDGEQGSLTIGISGDQARRNKPFYKQQEEKGKTSFKPNDFGIPPQRGTQPGTDAQD